MKMKLMIKKAAALILIFVMAADAFGCGLRQEKAPKPMPKATVEVNNGNADAGGEGKGQSDKPLIIGCFGFDKNFNPFSAANDSDRRAVDLTQIRLLGTDRRGEAVYNGINGEVRSYNGKNYTYYGPANVKARFNKKKNETVYTIRLRKDLLFSDGRPITIDDVIFNIYVLCDGGYFGPYDLGKRKIKGLLNYQLNDATAEDRAYGNPADGAKKKKGAARKRGRVKNISGIRRVNKYKMTITSYGYEKDMIKSLQVPICPLHYYGDDAKYDYEKNMFGFKRGRASFVCSEKKPPLGAGPYRYVKCENNIAYFASNEIYYKGCPKIAFVQMKDMEDSLNSAQKRIDDKANDEKEGQMSDEPSDKDLPIRNAQAVEMAEGTVDVINAGATAEDLFWISQANSNKELSGDKIEVEFVPSGVFQYIGINAKNVKIGKSPFGKSSTNLRKAIAVAFGASRSEIWDYYGEAASVIQYPTSQASYFYIDEDEEGYAEAYNVDAYGNRIFNDGDNEEKSREAAKAAIKSYLDEAGIDVVDKGTGSAQNDARNKAKITYTILVVGSNNANNNDDYPLRGVISKACGLLEEAGVNINVKMVKDSQALKKILKKGKQQLWVGTCGANSKYGLFGGYPEGWDVFGIRCAKTSRLGERLRKSMDADKDRRAYKKCFDAVIGMAVDVPVCEMQTAMLYSPERVDADTMVKDSTVYYSWVNEIHNVVMK